MDGSELRAELRRRLLEARAGDGGFGARPGQPAEPEPTALAAIALDDERARDWLLDHQAPDGGFGLRIPGDVSDAATPLAAIALPAGPARERALDHLLRNRAQRVPDTPEIPHRPDVAGWGWTPDTFGWVEPTARAVLALRLLRPDAGPAIADGVALLEDRECVGGGWNYGNRVVLGEEIPPYAQTTAVALLGLQGLELPAVARGLATLRRLWPAERGGLTLAQALAAFRLAGDPEAGAVERALGRRFARTGFLGDVVALAWAAIATGEGLERIRVEGP
ncbi:MAG TPA: prenyltransferase/squalene oxidase repeat-containing protein [Actinomycetota bacterium]|nr:prenyltransferase/squalene oxidase repeat-containing protein [Actinomycetota bacterium]